MSSQRNASWRASPLPQSATTSDGTWSFTSPHPSGSSLPKAKSASYYSSGNAKVFPRISRPLELLRPTYDVVVVGSGYGGGVAASRMARGGQSVCLLELGREKWPGEYPTTAVDAVPEFQITGTFNPFDIYGNDCPHTREGDAQALYHLVLGQGQNAFVANGLGGTSLVNANVFLEADQKTLDLKVWPESLRKADSLRKYYDRARDMLQPETYPEDFPTLPKLELLKKQAHLMGKGRQFYRAPQTTRFENGPNRVGVRMNASALTGMDATGLNDGSKSSTLVNYLADAWNWGTEIFCGCEVRYIKKHPSKDGYLVFFAWHGSGRAKFKNNFHNDLMWIYARKFVFLGAGALGTSEILLRSKALGLSMSNKVGKNMSGNGDILAFGYNTDFNVNAMGKANPDPEKPVGPAITGVIDCRDQTKPLDGFVLQEGSVPEALVPALQWVLTATPGKVYLGNDGILRKVQKILAAAKSALLGPYRPDGSMERTQIYLVMSHDSNQATLSLSDDKPVLRFLGVGRSEHVRRLNDLLAKLTNVVGGTLINNIFFAAFGKQQVTVHPIGGANMSRDGSSEFGATTEFGELLSGDGNSFHEGVVVVDGAVIPSALGANPLATITALAEKSVEAVAQKHNVMIDYETGNGELDLFGPPAKSLPAADEAYSRALCLIRKAQDASKKGIEFSEIMTGYMYQGGDIEDHKIAANAARSSCSLARVFLSVHSWDIDSFLSLKEHQAMVTGTYTCSSLPGSPFLILRGSFKLFQVDSCTSDAREITYDFDMISTEGDILHFHGQKLVDPSVALSPWKMWKATSTLCVTLTKCMDNVVVSRGILQLESGNFVSELQTLAGTGNDWVSRISSIIMFLWFFLIQLFRLFFAPFRRLQWPPPPPKKVQPRKTAAFTDH